MIKNKGDVKSLALSQIVILIIGIIAIGYALGSEVGFVSGAHIEIIDEKGGKKIIIDDEGSAQPQGGTPEANPETAVPSGEKPDVEGVIGGEKSPSTAPISTPKIESPKGEDDSEIDTAPTVNNTPAKLKGLLDKKAFNVTGQIIKNAGYAFAIAFAVKQIAPYLGADASGADAAAKAAGIGYFVAWGASKLGVSKAIAGFLKTGLNPGYVTAGIGIIVAAAIFILSYKKSEEQRIGFQCLPWAPKLGGVGCDKCNEGTFPCTIYQCKSLGQACELINEGTKEELCVWKSRNDTKPPIIQPWKDVLTNGKFEYTPENKISPPDLGVFIKYSNGCIPAFTPFTFGIILDEPASCKIDVERKKTYDEMVNYFGGNSLFRYNHTQTISLPSNESLSAENITLKNDGNFELYVRCIDVNGYPIPSSPSSTFVFKYCVQKGPDTQAPVIQGTNPRTIPEGVPISFNQSTLDLEVYVNEPSDCKWTRDKDLAYSQMESNMSCSSSVFEMNAEMLYKCTTTLTSLRSKVNNEFYFRCMDKPKSPLKERNVMTRGYKFIVKGTQPLVIDSVSPNGTIKDSVDPVQLTLNVKTSAGYNEGDASCYYSESCYNKAGRKDKYTMFYYPQGSSSHEHSQDLWVSQGSYQCSIRCVDLGGNSDTKNIEYNVLIDGRSPSIVRVFREDAASNNYLKIITDEKGRCVYDTTSCSYLFDDGVEMNTIHDTEHYTEWDATSTYYIKCEDAYKNSPAPNKCSIILKPFEIFERGE
ncbi:MAG TPA: hypothetical protein VJH92_00305 [Candidatus Nanoarchaeia archaeon]|nr:hypothetical protein [Candidatus Nanoarchaeia archaeon]